MAARKWTDAQRKAQAEAIHNWQPWRHSTGATSAAGKVIVSQNAYRGAMRPFCRLVAEAHKAFLDFDTLTEEKVESIERRMIELCGKANSRRGANQ